MSNAATLDPLWLKAAFLMLLVGYGTKMGLAPMHTWLPDAHSEAPSMVSTLLSGALLNCAFLGILRGHSVLAAAGLGRFQRRPADFFRPSLHDPGRHVHRPVRPITSGCSPIQASNTWASSRSASDWAGLAGTGAMLHAVSHSLTKGMLFMCAGQLLHTFNTKTAADVRHALQRLPITGFLWLAGFLAITGSPPFGLFLSELTILKGMLDTGRWPIAAVYLATLGIIFIAMARVVLPMVFGGSGHPVNTLATTFPPDRMTLWYTIPATALLFGTLLLGLYIPRPVWTSCIRGRSSDRRPVMANADLVMVENGEAVDLKTLPKVPFETFRRR